MTPWKVGQRALFRGQVVEILSVQREDYLSDDYYTLFFVDPSTGRADWHIDAYVSPLPKEPACDE
jgi:hypothetical protein